MRSALSRCNPALVERLFAAAVALCFLFAPTRSDATVDITSATSVAAWMGLSGEGAAGVCNAKQGGKIDEYEDAVARVQKVIHDRSSTIQPDLPVITDGAGRVTNVTNTLFLQFGSNVLGELRVRVYDMGSKILDRWKTHWRVIKDAELRPRVVAAQSMINQGRLDFNATGGLSNPFVDGQPLFPSINEIILNRNLLEQLSGTMPTEAELAADAAKAIKKGGLQLRVTELLSGKQSIESLGGTLDLELQLQQELLLIKMKAAYLDRIKALGIKVAGEFGERAAQAAMKIAPTDVPNEIGTWYAYMSLDPFVLAREWFDQAPKILDDMVSELRRSYPIGALEAKDPVLPTLSPKVEALKNAKKPTDWLDGLVSPDGLELEIKSAKLYAKYDPKLGSTFLSTRANPHLVNRYGPLLVLWHGDGTTRSNVASWRSLLAFYEANGFNALAQSMPVSGGPNLRTMRDTITALNESNKHIREGIELDQPMLVVGRSMGSSKGLLHDIFFGGKKDPIDGYFLMSYSNPFTMEFQTKSVYEQVKAGLFSGLIKESLASAMSISKETLAMLKAAKKADPKAFESFGNNVVFFQGDSDADGGPTVLADLKAFIAEYAPLAHLRDFHMPHSQREAYDKILRGEEVIFTDANGNKIRVEEDMLEGQHFIHSNRDNNPVGNPKTQTLQSFADMYRFMDYLADGPGGGREWPTARERQSAARLMASRIKSGAGNSFFWTYLQRLQKSNPKYGLDESAVRYFQNPKNNTADLNERFAFVEQYWAKEKARIVKQYKLLGMLPNL